MLDFIKNVFVHHKTPCTIQRVSCILFLHCFSHVISVYWRLRPAAVRVKVGFIVEASLTFSARVPVFTGVYTHVIIQPRLGAVLLVTLCARERLLVVFHPDVLVQTRLFRVHLFAVSTRELWRVVTVLGLNVTTQAAVTCEFDATHDTFWLLPLDSWKMI